MTSGIGIPLARLGAIALVAVALAGCTTARQDRALVGGAIGATTGAVIGGLAAGTAGGVVAGAVLGGAGGAIIADATRPRSCRATDAWGRPLWRAGRPVYVRC